MKKTSMKDLKEILPVHYCVSEASELFYELSCAVQSSKENPLPGYISNQCPYKGEDIDKPMPKLPKSELKDVFGPHLSKTRPLFGDEL